MQRFLAVPLALIFAGCAASPEPKAEPPAPVVTCPDSQDDVAARCDNGKPLCAFDKDRACLSCRCTTYPPGEHTTADPSELTRAGGVRK